MRPLIYLHTISAYELMFGLHLAASPPWNRRLNPHPINNPLPDANALLSLYFVRRSMEALNISICGGPECRTILRKVLQCDSCKARSYCVSLSLLFQEAYV